MPIKPTHRDITTFLLAALILVVIGTVAHARPAETLQLTGQLDLARLIDLCAEELPLRIEYDPKDLKGASVTMRLREEITADELWSLTNQLLATRGLAALQLEGGDLITIRKAADAPGLARLEDEGLDAVRAGYATLLYEPTHRTIEEITEVIRPLLSKPGGALTPLGKTGVLLLSDYTPKLEQLLKLIERVDQPAPAAQTLTIPATGMPAAELVNLVSTAASAHATVAGITLKGQLVPLPHGEGVLLVAPANEIALWRSLIEELDAQPAAATVETIPVEFVEAAKLATFLNETAEAYAGVTGAPLGGKVIAAPAGDALVLVAPPVELDQWRSLIARFDTRQRLETRTYAPRHFSARQVADLIEQTVKDPSPRGSGERFRVVADELTGTLMVSATPVEHERIGTLIERLDAVPPAAQRPVRTYSIRNRNVNEIVDVLNELIEAGVLGDAARLDREAPEERAPLQRTEREVLPPGARPIVPRDRTWTAGAASPDPSRHPEMSLGDEDVEPPIVLTADEGTSTLIAVGEPRRLEQLDELIKTLDVRQPQVMLEVLVVNLTDADTFDLGVELQKLEISGSTIISLTSLFGLGVLGGSDGEVAPPDPGGTALVLSPGDFRVLITALETLNKGRLLNLPKVLVSNNQEATLDALLQQPFASVNASNTVATTSFGGTQDAGTSVTVRPQIAEGDHLLLEYTVSLSTFVGQSTNPALPPPRQQNSLQSTVTIPDDYTVVVGGLETVTSDEGVSQVPLLGWIPLIGEAFKRRANANNHSRFFVFIRVSILRDPGFLDLRSISDDDAEAAALPDEWPEVRPRFVK